MTVNTSAKSLKVGDLDGNGKDGLIAGLTSGGLWARYNNADWTRLSNVSPLRIVTGDLDGNGQDEVVADRGTAGLWVFSNNSTWKRLTTLVSQGLAAGDLDSNGQEDLVVDFGNGGLWAYYNNRTTRVKLDNRSPERLLVTNLDRNGKGDVVADFVGAGLWARYNNSGAFRQLRAWPLQAIAAGSSTEFSRHRAPLIGLATSVASPRASPSLWPRRAAPVTEDGLLPARRNANSVRVATPH